MPNPTITLQGKVHYNSLVQLDKFGKWSLKLYLNTPSVEAFRELQATTGILNRLSKDDEGYYANFSRPPKKTYGQGSRAKEIVFAPPIVLERDDRTPFRGNIGYGSDITITCEIFPYNIPASGGKKGKALRLTTVRVDNLVPYDAQEHGDERQIKEVAVLASTPPQPENSLKTW